MKHYEFTGDTEIIFGVTLRRIKSKKTGELGGWIEKEANISDACVGLWHDLAMRVSGNAWSLAMRGSWQRMAMRGSLAMVWQCLWRCVGNYTSLYPCYTVERICIIKNHNIHRLSYFNYCRLG